MYRPIRKLSERRRKVVLVCYGITADGVRELMGYRLEDSEAEAGRRSRWNGEAPGAKRGTAATRAAEPLL